MAAYPTFEIHLLGLPENPSTGGSGRFADRDLPSLEISPSQLPPMRCSFEQVFRNFSVVDRLFPEPDGSFVWTGEGDSGDWQLDGMLYDHAGVVRWCELKGACPLEQWKILLTCFDWPAQGMVAYFLRERFFSRVEELDVLWQ